MPVSDRPRIEDALRLRRWTLRVFSSPNATHPTCSAATWKLFLGAERCALPLKNVLVQHGKWREMPPEVQQLIDATAVRELQEVLSARATLAEIDRLANALSLDVVVLKGGVAALSQSNAVALADIDVLATPSHAQVLAAKLDEAGYASYGGGSHQHLSKRTAPETLPVEVHATLILQGEQWLEIAWKRLTPLEGMTVLERLSPLDHLWHLLIHVVVQHRFRAAVIRDLLLIGDAVDECSGEDLDELVKMIDQSPDARDLRGTLTLARQVRGAGVTQDHFMTSATMVYLFHLHGNRIPGPMIFGSDVGSSVFAMLQGPSAYGRLCRTVIWRKTSGRSMSPPIAWIEARAPRLGRTVRVGSRMIRLAAAAPLALFIAIMAKRFTKKVAVATN